VEPTPTTPDLEVDVAPITPAKDPALIDRRGLVGVGDLTTPRWTTRDSEGEQWRADTTSDKEDEIELPRKDHEEDSDPDSPWTIEAIDGDGDGDGDEVEVQVCVFGFLPLALSQFLLLL
jgi:dual specificity tyrosine-phosphorylation-regulated kinase 2/3/4